MKIVTQIIILTICILTTFVYAYNQAIKDVASDIAFIDASKTFIALKSLRENEMEDTITFLENDLDLALELNRNLLEVRSVYFDHINFQSKMDYGYYEHMLEYRSQFPIENKNYRTVENLNWLLSNTVKR